jgi:hypothetical protein
MTMPRLFWNRVSLVGTTLTTVSALLFIVVLLADWFGLHTNPYLGIVFFIVLPALFLFGLALIPFGMWLERRRRARGDADRPLWPRLDLNNPTHRRTTALALVLTFANLVIVSLAAFRGIEFMDSSEFCGEVCHEVMEPEYVAFQDGPHSRMECVTCHIGPGAPWFVKSKLDGTRQVFAVLFDTHSRPIKSPVHDLRPARDTCEQCHWPEKFHGDKVNVYREYADDEAVTETMTQVRVHVGGGSEKLGVATGIHWHMNVANEVDYIATDDRREVIPYVRVKDRHGNVREYYVEGVTPEELQQGEQRRMDCVDCHNRPTHPFSPSPEKAVDSAIGGGEMSRSLPYIRREAVAALKINYPDRVSAEQEIAARLGNFYKSNYPEVAGSKSGEVDRAIQAVQRVYRRNVFPKMNVTWGTHPNHIGHTTSPGCFRCHDDNHKTKDGRTIGQDCSLCHEIE